MDRELGNQVFLVLAFLHVWIQVILAKIELDVGFFILLYCIDHVKTISDVSHMSGLSIYSKTSMAVSLHQYFQCLPNLTYRVHYRPILCQ